MIKHLPWVLGGSALLAALSLQSFARLDQRVANLEAERMQQAAREQGLTAELGHQRSFFEQAAETARVAHLNSEAALRGSLDHQQSALEAIACALQAYDQELSQLEQAQAEIAGQAFDQRIAGLDQRLQESWNSFQGLVGSALERNERTDQHLAQIEGELPRPRDLPNMWRELVGPVVQLAGESSVGSGVLLESRPAEDAEGGYITYLVTAWHVVRDIQGSLDRTEVPVPVAMYLEGGGLQNGSAKLLRFDADIDAALLVLDTRERVPCGARLASRQRLSTVRIFDSIYAVGCPLGNDPIPTPGEIAADRREIEGAVYWMINAPTFIGNSGGGIFDAQSHELLGIFSKIYNYGTVRPTVVPHMGLVTPLDVVYDWLEGVGYACVETGSVRAQVASAPREQ